MVKPPRYFYDLFSKIPNETYLRVIQENGVCLLSQIIGAEDSVDFKRIIPAKEDFDAEITLVDCLRGCGGYSRFTSTRDRLLALCMNIEAHYWTSTQTIQQNYDLVASFKLLDYFKSNSDEHDL